MTVIAWDGRTLAADKRVSYGNMSRTTTKIRRVGDCLVGIAGSGSIGLAVVEWLGNGADPAAFPKLQEDADDHANVLVIRPDGCIEEYARTAYPTVYEDKFAAIGSGRDFAVAAMHLGKTAREAVEVACLFDTGCGNGIDTLEFAC